MKISNSAKRVLLKIAMIFIIPYFLFLIICLIYSYADSYQSRFNSDENELAMYQSFLEDDLDKITYFMSDLVANDKTFSCFYYPQESLDAYLNGYTLTEKFKSIMKTSEQIDMMGIMSVDNDVYLTNYKHSYSYTDKEGPDRYLKTLLTEKQDEAVGKWKMYTIDGRNYFVQILGGKGVYCFCLVSVENASRAMDNEEGYRYITFGDNEEFWAYADQLKEDKIVLHGDRSRQVTGRTFNKLVVKNYSDVLSCNVYLIDSIRGIFAMEFLSVIVLLVIVLFIVIIMKCYKMAKQRFLQPLDTMVETMNEIASGKIESKLDVGSSIEEYKKVEEAFNDMIQQVSDLRILAYDKEIQMQRTQLQYYQLQIRPHFFLNCLKSLYALTEAGRYDESQEMILDMSEYMRRVFQSHEFTISLKEELENIHAYVKIQQLNKAIHPVMSVNIEEELKEFPVPPLSLLTLVENSFRYVRANQEFQLHIKATMIEDMEDRYMNITIKDNGLGFSEEALQKLNGKDQAVPENHVGIYNVKQRFYILYGNSCSFVFSNINGANIDIFIPLWGQENTQTWRGEER